MDKKLLSIAIVAAFSAGTAQAATFTNGNFEAGTLTGWTGGGGTWYGSPAAPVDPTTYNLGTPNNTIVGVGTDPITGASTVYGGSHAVRVNDNVNNYSVSTLRQSVTGYSDNAIYFAWNAVLENSHGRTDSDYFSLQLVDNTSNTTLVNRAYSSAGTIGAGTTGVTWSTFAYPAGIGGIWYSSGWVTESIDLVALGAVGHDFTLTLLASDCPYGGHAGYVYLDGFGGTIPDPNPTPEPGSLALLGIALSGLAASRRKKVA